MPGSTAPPWSIPYALLTDTADANVLSKSMADRLQVLFAGQSNLAFRYDFAQKDANATITAWDGTINLNAGGWTKNGTDLVVPTTATYFIGFNIFHWYASGIQVTAQVTVDGGEVARVSTVPSATISISNHGGNVMNLTAGQKIRLNIYTSSGTCTILASPQTVLYGHSII